MKKEIDIGLGIKLNKIKKRHTPNGVLFNEYEIKNILHKLQGGNK